MHLNLLQPSLASMPILSLNSALDLFSVKGSSVKTRSTFASKRRDVDCYLNDPDPTFQDHQRSIRSHHLFRIIWVPICVYSNYSAISLRNRKLSRRSWSDLSMSPEVKLTTPSDSQHMSSDTSSIVTIALSRTNTLFSADDLDLTFQGHQRSNWLNHPIRSLWVPIRLL